MLLTSEIARLRFETGYNLVGAGAEPYISYVAVFDQVIQTYVTGGVLTSSSTMVSATSPPTPSRLTLASSVGFNVGDRVVIDVDDAQEIATVRAVGASTIDVILQNDHQWTYPVAVEGPEGIVRAILRRLVSTQNAIDASINQAGLKRAEEIEWYAGKNGGSSAVEELYIRQKRDRDELCSALGIPNLRSARAGASGAVALF